MAADFRCVLQSTNDRLYKNNLWPLGQPNSRVQDVLSSLLAISCVVFYFWYISYHDQWNVLIWWCLVWQSHPSTHYLVFGWDAAGINVLPLWRHQYETVKATVKSNVFCKPTKSQEGWRSGLSGSSCTQLFPWRWGFCAQT